jgi:hypothetical protein
VRQACGKAVCDRVARVSDDRNLASRFPGRDGRRRGQGDDDVDSHRDELCGQRRKTLRVVRGKSRLDPIVAPFDITEIAQARLEGILVFGVQGVCRIAVVEPADQLRPRLRMAWTRERR